MAIPPSPAPSPAPPPPPAMSSSIQEEEKAPPPRFPFSVLPFLPQHLPLSKERTYLGLRRNTFLLVLLGASLSLLILILGLSIGLSSKKHGSSSYIPYPSNKALQTGEGTYYGTGLGACGIVSTDTDAIVAVSWRVFDAVQVGGNPNTNPLCGLKVWATRVREETGKNVSVVATVVDRCTGCKATDLDFSPRLFNVLAAQGLGRVQITWAWL